MDAYKKITSVANTEIIATTRLHLTKERHKKKMFIAEGLRTCMTLLEHHTKLHLLFVTHEMLEHVADLPDAKVICVTPAVMNKISTAETPSGILGVFHQPPPPSKTLIAQANGLVLDSLQDPGNVGTLLRTCAALGKKTVIMINCVDMWNPKVVQATAGMLASLTIIECTIEELLEHKKNNALHALIPHGGISIAKADCSKGLLIIGSEGHGIQKALIKAATQEVTIPMPGEVESMNAAIAGAIGMYIAWCLPNDK